VAVDWHVYQLLRGSSYTLALFGHDISLDGKALGLGMLGLVRIAPVIIFALFGASFSIWTGGAATVFLTAWVAWKYPQLRRYINESAADG
jgi:FtsH-binding integral membrane protein